MNSMWVDVVLCRRNGLRLRKSEWPAPVRGELRIEESERDANSFKRGVRVANLLAPTGASRVHAGVLLPIFDPVLIPAPPGHILIRGIEIASMAASDGSLNVYEHEQLWLCTQALKAE